MILIIGANGFVGNGLVKSLVQKKYPVRVLIRSQRHVKKFRDLGIEVFYGDIRKLNSLDLAFEGVETVVNLAASHGKLSLEELNETNVNGLKNILEACSKAKVKHLLHYSSVAVYGEQLNVTEKSKMLPYDDYGLSKKEGEKVIKEFKEKDLKISIIRPSHIYGFGGKSNILNFFKAVKKRIYVVFGPGKNLINVVYIKDLIDVTIKLLESKENWGHDYIITDGNSYELSDFSNIIAETCKVPKPWKIPKLIGLFAGMIFDIISSVIHKNLPLSKSRVINLSRSRSFNVDKAKKELNYKPQFDFEKGSKLAYKWYSENGLL